MYVIMWIAAWSALAAGAGVAAWWFGRVRRKRESPLISLVALLREPVIFDPLVLATVASRALNADLGDGSSEGEDGFVVCGGIANTIVHQNRPYLINCFPIPYVDDLEAAAELFRDLRARRYFREHKAWFSFDALDIDGMSTREEIAERYRKLAKLFAEFLDDNWLLIYTPQTGHAYAINEETEQALQSDDPLAALAATRTSPVISISDDDELLEQAVMKAKQTWPQFLAAFEAAAGTHFSVKAPLTYEGVTEYIWIEVNTIEGDRVYGALGNEPANLGPWQLGSKTSVAFEDVQDWCYVDAHGNPQGAFSMHALQEAARRPLEK